MSHKIGVISDLNEKDIWKKFILNKSVDEWIFLGDYIHSSNHDYKKCINNLEDIIKFKYDNKDKVTLLLGNEEMKYVDHRYKHGIYLPDIAYVVRELLKDNEKLFKVAHNINDYLFTHAGVTEQWIVDSYTTLTDTGYPRKQLPETLNDLHNSYRQYAVHHIGKSRGGYYKSGGITWADRTDLMMGIIPEWNQIVGHNPTHKIQTVTRIEGKTYKDRSITFTNCLDSIEECLIINL